MMQHTTSLTPDSDRTRVLDLLARLRTRQLDLALRGKITASARYAHRASRVRRYSQQRRVVEHAA